MKKLKRIIGGFLCAVLCCSVFAACEQKDTESDALKLYKQDTGYIKSSFGSEDNKPLYSTIPTYRKASTNDVTYVGIEDFVNTACTALNLSIEKVRSDSFNILNSAHTCVMNIDAKNNIVTYYRQDMILPEVNGNNGVLGDPIVQVTPLRCN